MEVKDAGRSVWKKDLKPGDLFAYTIGSSVALGLFLAKNALGYAAVALTHPPGKQAIIPSLVSNQFLENDTTVFLFEDPSMSVNQAIGTLESKEPNVGAVMSSTAGTFLRCVRDAQEYDVNVRTGDIVFPGHLPRFWTADWAIEDRNENVLYESKPKEPGS